MEAWDLGRENIGPVVLRLLAAVDLLRVATDHFQRLVKLILTPVLRVNLNLGVATIQALIIADTGQVAAPIVNHVDAVTHYSLAS